MKRLVAVAVVTLGLVGAATAPAEEAQPSVSSFTALAAEPDPGWFLADLPQRRGPVEFKVGPMGNRIRGLDWHIVTDCGDPGPVEAIYQNGPVIDPQEPINDRDFFRLDLFGTAENPDLLGGPAGEYHLMLRGRFERPARFVGDFKFAAEYPTFTCSTGLLEEIVAINFG
jgi:hypothetical protein